MATRSRIGFETVSGAVMHIYCHFDGYIDGVGKALIVDHNDVNKAHSLVNGGNCTTISNQVQRSDPSISWSKDRQSYKQECYGTWEEFQYLWDSRKACWLWRKAGSGNWKRLELALNQISQAA